MIVKILFVCSGNTCRSPMAEYLFKDSLKNYKNMNIEVISAGIFAIDESEPSFYSVEVMKEKGIDISSHRSRRLNRKLIEDSSFIFTMTDEQVELLRKMYPEFSYKIFKLASEDIEDPFGESIEKYREVRDKIEKGVKDILKNIYVRVEK